MKISPPPPKEGTLVVTVFDTCLSFYGDGEDYKILDKNTFQFFNGVIYFLNGSVFAKRKSYRSP